MRDPIGAVPFHTIYRTTSPAPTRAEDLMTTEANAARPLAETRPAASVTPIRPLAVASRDTERARLLRRLAADRLRDLRDDGVTIGYMARMYDVEKAMMEEMIAALGLGAR
jgi:hypothetical protein